MEREKRKEGKEKREKRNVSTHSPCQETTPEVRKNLGFRPVPYKKKPKGERRRRKKEELEDDFFFVWGKIGRHAS